jgi:phage gp29-like protein
MKQPPKPKGAILYNPIAIETVLNELTRLADPDLILQANNLGRHELRKLETDDEIAAALETRREAVIATPWRLEPFEGEPAEWLAEEITDHMESLLRGAWSAVPYGYAVQEIVYRKAGGRIGIGHISEKPMEWFEPKTDGRLIFMPPNGGHPEPVDLTAKFLLTRRNPTYRNPFGEALLSRAYWPWFFRHNGWRFWMQFMERFAEPLLLGQVYSPADFVAAMQNLGMNAVIGVGKEEEVKAVTQSASGEFERVESALLARIQRLILGQTLTSNVGDAGSYAAAKVHNEVRNDKRRADIRLVTKAAQRLVDALWWLNGFTGAAPTIYLQDETGLETERAERDAKLVQAGIVKFTEQYLLDNYDFTKDHFEIPQGRPTPPQGQGSFSLAANGQRFSADQEMVETLVDAALKQASSPIPADQIAKAIRNARNPDDLAERLAKLYAGNDAAEFRELMEKALYFADVLGYVTAEKRIGVDEAAGI